MVTLDPDVEITELRCAEFVCELAPIEIKTRKLNEIHLKKRELILKLQELQNG